MIEFIMIAITPLPAIVMAMYVMMAPPTALEQHVAGERPQNQPIMLIMKKIITAKVVALDRIIGIAFKVLYLFTVLILNSYGLSLPRHQSCSFG